MVLELGPWPTTDVLQWSRFARRIVVELRAVDDESGDPDEELPPHDVIELWSQTVDGWTRDAEQADTAGEPFRWTAELEPEVVEYLLHGLDRCIHSPKVMSWVTSEDAERQRAFTTALVQAFVDGLVAEGAGCQHYADQILTSLSGLLSE